MSEQPDTAAIRAGYGPAEGARVSAAIGCILALCDAVDELRSQLDRRATMLTYDGAHKRVRRDRGPASAQQCAHCDKPAATWAYDKQDEAERTTVRGVYSDDPAHYLPLCRSCHSWFDAPTECPQGHPYDEENTQVRPGTNYRGCKTCNRERERDRSALVKLQADLDAARAQLDVYRGHCDHAQTAERWEAAADTYNNYRLAWKARAEAAEARITAVERLRDAWNTSIPTMHLAESLNLALIEGSE